MPALSTDIIVALVGVFLAVAVAAGAIVSLVLERRVPERRRLQELAQPNTLGLFDKAPSLTDAPDPRLQRLSKLVRKSPKEMSRLRQRLLTAGFKGYAPAILYAVSELILPIVVGFSVLLAFGFRAGGLFGYFMAFTAAFLAYSIPGFVVGYYASQRKKEIRNGLPDALDLMIVCIEAGSGLDQAIVKTSEELALSYPALAEELTLVTTEIRAGKPRLEAFRNLAARTKVDDVRSLVAMLVQTDRFGTSISAALRQHAETCRTKRRQRAEERAAKLGVKLAFPLVFCLFPAFYVVTLAPAAIKIYRTLVAPAN
jgi:tight adherence protein C